MHNKHAQIVRFSSHVEAEDLVITGLSTFVLDDFSFIPSPSGIQLFRHILVLDAVIPAIDIDASKYALYTFVYIDDWKYNAY